MFFQSYTNTIATVLNSGYHSTGYDFIPGSMQICLFQFPFSFSFSMHHRLEYKLIAFSSHADPFLFLTSLNVFYMPLPSRSFCPFENSVIPLTIIFFTLLGFVFTLFGNLILFFFYCVETPSVYLNPQSFQGVMCMRNSIIYLYECILNRKAISNRDLWTQASSAYGCTCHKTYMKLHIFWRSKLECQ